MRHRERSSTSSPIKGRTHSWGIGWKDVESSIQKKTSFIKDKTNPKVANPLLSVQYSFNTGAIANVAVNGDKAFSRYRGEAGIDPSLLNVHRPYSVQSSQAWAAHGISAALAKLGGSAPDLATNLAEASEGFGLKELLKSSPDVVSTIAKQWLFYSFAFAPTVSVIFDLINYEIVTDAAVHNFVKNMKWQKFEVDLLNDTSTVPFTHESGGIWPFGTFYPGVQETRVEEEYTRSDKIWFSCMWKNKLEEKTANYELYAKVRARISGFKPTIGTVYELTPYSWLVDYFVPIGKLIDQQQRRDTFSIRMPCVMHESEIRKDLTGYLKYTNSFGSTSKKVLKGHARATVKRRAAYVTAKPGLTLRDLSNSQVANIVAVAL